MEEKAMEEKPNYLVKKHLTNVPVEEPIEDVKSVTKEDVLNQIQSLRGKLNVIIEELDCLEHDVNIMKN